MRRILVTARSFGQSDDQPVQLLKGHGYDVIKLNNQKPLNAAGMRPEIHGFDAVIAGLDEIDRSVIENAPGLKVISRYGVGYDNVDLAAAREHGVIVTITPGTNHNSVADLAMALLLLAARRVPLTDQWAKTGRKPQIGMDVWGKTIGIIGLGKIGRGVAVRARGFSMDILYYDTILDDDFAREHGIRYADPDEIYEKADFITIHTPLTEQTLHFIGAPQMAKMKRTVILINTARGGIIDEQALYEALRDGVIAAAALDVTENEPLADSPLLSLDNCIITPHIGSYTKEAVHRMGMTAAQNVIDVLETGHCKNQITEAAL